ncbi:hypothetical protein ABZ863_17040 [Saccharomonospora sp. NPDC046836]|uniref:hypothetical protein n=1 Tax=Saccharomonospora sp. NPDC046836 TaxID=3156921 RepID=UPI0033C0E4A9
MTTTVQDFADLEAEFNAYVGTINYATMVTVDARNRPRTRVLIPVWENVDGQPGGWLATYKTPVKAAHIAGNPHTNFYPADQGARVGPLPQDEPPWCRLPPRQLLDDTSRSAAARAPPYAMAHPGHPRHRPAQPNLVGRPKLEILGGWRDASGRGAGQ